MTIAKGLKTKVRLAKWQERENASGDGPEREQEKDKSLDCKVQAKWKEGAREKKAAVANQEP